MARFDKRLPQNNAFATKLIASESEPDVLVWSVVNKRGGRSCKIDLTEFAEGNGLKGMPAMPNLIKELAPAIRLWSHERTIKTIGAEIRYLRSMWRFIGFLAATGRAVGDAVSAISPTFGVMFRTYLLVDKRLATATARHVLNSAHKFLEMARRQLGLVPHLLLWPTIYEPQRILHEDIEPSDMRRLYQVAKGVVRRFAIAYREGAALLAAGETVGPELRSEALRIRAASLTRNYLDVALNEPAKSAKLFKSPPWSRPTFPLPAAYSGGTSFDRFRWFVPSTEEAAASLTLVLLHTGWNLETALNIDVSSPDAWYQNRLASDSGGTVAIFALKGRTNREQIAFSLIEPEFHPFRVITDMIERTRPLRDMLHRTIASIEQGELGPSQLDDLKELKCAASSPWLYFKRAVGGRTAFSKSRVGVITGLTMARYFSPLRRDANIPQNITASDLRDGFVSFLYENSLFNILLVTRALGHKNLASTKHYLRQRRMRAVRFAEYTNWASGVFEDILRFQTVDPTVLFIRGHYGEITEEQRARLTDHRQRTRMGMGCLDPMNPPDSIAPTHVGGPCTVHRCTLCYHGVVFRSSFEPLAKRQAELSVIRGQTPIRRWDASSLQEEWLGIIATIERAFPGREAEFDSMVSEHIERLHRGDAYLFNQIGSGEIMVQIP